MNADEEAISHRLLDTDLTSMREAVRRFISFEGALNDPPAALWDGIVRQGWLDALVEPGAPSIRMLLMFNTELGRSALALPLAETAAPLLAARRWPSEKILDPPSRLGKGSPIALSVVGEGSVQRTEAMTFHEGRASGLVYNVEHVPLASELLIIDPLEQQLAWCELPCEGVTSIASKGYADVPWHDVALEQAPIFVGSCQRLQWLISVIRLAAVARAWGAAARSVEELAEYTKIREQFGQVIGRFQSMQHRLANLQITLNASRVLMNRAAWSFDAGEEDWAAHTNAACCYAGRTLRHLALECQHGFGAIGERGLIGLTIPVADGGMGLGALEQFAFDEEINNREAPSYSYATAQLLAPSLVRYGNPQQRERFLPLMLRGDAVFCLGYSEPNSGSDLASLKTRAERDGDGWVVNGSKIWTTLGTVGDYVWLAARTDPAQARHGGISVFIVPLKSKGITIRPLQAMNGERPCAVFYDDVRLPPGALVGKVNEGWSIITHALSQERILMGAFASRLALYLQRIVTELRRISARIPGFMDRPGLRTRVGEIAADVQACRLLALHASVIAAAGGKPIAEAAISKTFAGELEERMAEAAMDWFGPDAVLSRGSTGSVLGGLIAHSLIMGIMYVIGGGSNDIQRNIIAQTALGLPR
jgi:alkylation response protein AidB-like acyl-CoA dehydrogenase